MKNKLIMSAFLFGACIAAPLALGQDNKSIHLEGKIISASATIPSGTSSAVLYDIPGKRILIVTQFCTSGFMGIELSGSKLGRVPTQSSANCTTYVPGVRFKAETLSCVSLFPAPEDIACLINAVIQ